MLAPATPKTISVSKCKLRLALRATRKDSKLDLMFGISLSLIRGCACKCRLRICDLKGLGLPWSRLCDVDD